MHVSQILHVFLVPKKWVNHLVIDHFYGKACFSQVWEFHSRTPLICLSSLCYLFFILILMFWGWVITVCEFVWGPFVLYFWFLFLLLRWKWFVFGKGILFYILILAFRLFVILSWRFISFFEIFVWDLFCFWLFFYFFTLHTSIYAFRAYCFLLKVVILSSISLGDLSSIWSKFVL